MGEPLDGLGQLLDGIAFGLHGGQQPAVAVFNLGSLAQRMKQPSPRYRRFAAAGRPGDGDEVGSLHTLDQFFHQAFPAKKVAGVGFLVRVEAEVGDTAVPHRRLLLIFKLNN